MNIHSDLVDSVASVLCAVAVILLYVSLLGAQGALALVLFFVGMVLLIGAILLFGLADRLERLERVR